MKQRLDKAMVEQGLVISRSQAESWVGLGKIFVNGAQAKKSGQMVTEADKLELRSTERYVSRAALKLASVAKAFNLNFKDQMVLDVGSSTGGFTDYALQHGARKAIAVELGTDQLHPSLRENPQIELHEQTDIRDIKKLSSLANIVVIDVSFISLRQILPHIATLCGPQTQIVAMVKPQFEAVSSNLKHKGVIKNDRMRRDILKDFEIWAQTHGFLIKNKADSQVAGAKGNLERFYLLGVVKQ